MFTQLMIIEGELVFLQLEVKMTSPGKGLDVRAVECVSHRLDSMVVHFTEISNIRRPGYLRRGNGKITCLLLSTLIWWHICRSSERYLFHLFW